MKKTINNGDTGLSIRTSLNQMFSDIYSAWEGKVPFRITVKISAANAGTPITIVSDASVLAVGSAAQVTVDDFLLVINGSVSWSGGAGTMILIQDTASILVASIPSASLIGNAVIGPKDATLGNAFAQQTALTVGKGITLLADANFAAGSDIYATITGYIG